MERALDGVAFLIGLAQVSAAMIEIPVLAVHLGHDVMKVPKIVGYDQPDGDGGRRGLALKDVRVDLNGTLVFLGGAVKIFLREVCAAQIAVKAGAPFVDLD